MNNQEKLSLIAEKIECCNKCAELAQDRLKTVPGEGNPIAQIVLLGEAPGKHESEQGRPFVGRAGQLLTNILEACGLKREDVYILNICKCRPPNNRTPSPEEAANCRPFLDLQLKVLNPKYIVCLGACAAQNLLNTTVPVGKLRGQWHEYNKVKVMVTWHPAYVLRNPAVKQDVWNDMQLIVAEA